MFDLKVKIETGFLAYTGQCCFELIVSKAAILGLGMFKFGRKR